VSDLVTKICVYTKIYCDQLHFLHMWTSSWICDEKHSETNWCK